jgi:hypothetical protein
VSGVGFLLNLSFPAEARHVSALHDLVVQAVRQAGGDEGRARDFAGQVAALAREFAGGQPRDSQLTVKLDLGPPIQAIVGGRALTLDHPASASAQRATADKEAGLHKNPAEAGRHDQSE